MYYIKYNGIDLTDMVKVRSVEIPSLPAIEHSSINMFERNGNVFNGLSYNNREINLVLLIQPSNPEDYDLYVGDVKRAFYTKDECKLYCGDESLYMWCVPVGDMTITELGSYCAEVEISLIAYDPYWYSEEVNVTNNNDKKTFTVKYDGDVPVYPILSIGFQDGTDSNNDGAYTFVQIENQANGDRLLIGGVPSTEGQVIKTGTKLLSDPMEGVNAGWSNHNGFTNRASGAKFTPTDSNCGLICRDFGSKVTGSTWHGACMVRDIGKDVSSFQVRVRMNHNSTGTNNDITYPYENEYKAGDKKTTTTKTYYYEVTASALWLRKGASTKYGKITAMPKGTRLTKLDLKNGWMQTTYDGKTGWCYTSYLKSVVVDNTTTTGSDPECNYATIKSTAIRATPSKSATNKKTIPAGKCIRINAYQTHEDSNSLKYCSLCNGKCKITNKDDEKYSEHQNCDKYYKMAKAYEGQTGYVLEKDLTPAREFCVEYDYEIDMADDKTGIIEIYGIAQDGTQLFRMGMYDDNKYYEFTYPMIYRNNGSNTLAQFLVDKTTAPNAKTRTDYNDSGKKVQKLLSGRYGDWNEFYGELYIERIKNKWYAYVQKINDGQIVKEIKSSAVTDASTEGKNLRKIVIYSGTQDGTDKASAMSITHIEVKTAAEIDETVTFTCQEFEPGDILEIDNSIPEVRLNGRERNDLIDVGSAFFALEPGDNKIKVASDDSLVNVDVIWSDKKL